MQDNIFGNHFPFTIEMDLLFDYTPGLSIPTNMVQLFLKFASFVNHNEIHYQNDFGFSRYYSVRDYSRHLHNKSTLRHIALTLPVPFGLSNLCVLIHDLREKDNYIRKINASEGRFVRRILDVMPNHLQNNKEVMFAAVLKQPETLQYASDELKNDKNFILNIIKRGGLAVEFTSNKLKNDKDFLLGAIKIDGSAIKYASNELKNDKEFVLEALKNNLLSLQHMNLEQHGKEELYKILASAYHFLSYPNRVYFCYNFQCYCNIVSDSDKKLLYKYFWDNKETTKILTLTTMKTFENVDFVFLSEKK